LIAGESGMKKLDDPLPDSTSFQGRVSGLFCCSFPQPDFRPRIIFRYTVPQNFSSSPIPNNFNPERTTIVETWHGQTPHTQGSSGRLKDQPAGERPRERLIERGAQALSPAELVAILIRTGLQGINAVEIGKQLVCKFGSLGAMARASVDDLRRMRLLHHH
jgi:hypothetical protein